MQDVVCDCNSTFNTLPYSQCGTLSHTYTLLLYLYLSRTNILTILDLYVYYLDSIIG